MMRSTITPGDLVIYRKTKHSTQPGPRAANVQPARHGDSYSYTVDKYWVVEELLDDGMIVAVTRRGKRHLIRPDDPMLHRASWLQKLLYRARFPMLPPAQSRAQQPVAN